MNFVLRVGGEAGWGIATTATIFSKVAMKLGYHVFSSKDYASQIRGGHNYHNVRISEKPIAADVEGVNLLLALDEYTLKQHLKDVITEGIILYDKKIMINKIISENNPAIKKITLIPIPLEEIKKELDEKNIYNAVFLGASAKCLGINFEIIKTEIEYFFSDKDKLKSILIQAARKGYDDVDITVIKLKPLNPLTKKLIDGNEAVALGALKAKVEFHVQYPMTPVSSILHNLAQEAVVNKKLIVMQAEDEIAVINMVLGASFAGKRAMTATSGGGFALMVESLGLAGMAEIPLVLIMGQRAGPSTGLPTKTEQGDLSFVLSSGTGDFPHVVIAPGSIEDCYTETKRAFYLAEKYQLPVIVLVDKQQVESFKAVDLESEEKNFVFDYEKKINLMMNVKDVDLNQDGLFKRYAQAYRTIPGVEKGMFTCAGDEHDEVGAIIENKEIRKKMMFRRMGKLIEIEKELPLQKSYGHEEAELTVIGWGSSSDAIREAVDLLVDEGKKINCLTLKYMLPFNTVHVGKLLKTAKKIGIVENNYSNQLGRLIAEKTGIIIKEKLLKYDGSAFAVDEVYEQLKKWLK